MPKLDSNIPSSIFCEIRDHSYCKIIFCCKFFLKSGAVITQMEREGGNRRKRIKQILRAHENHLLQASHKKGIVL